MGAVNQKPLTEAPKATSSPYGDTTGGRLAGARASNDYRQDFWNTLRGLPAVHNALAVGSDPLGGYLVPEDFERTLVESLEEHNCVRLLARVIQTSAKELKIPVVAAKGSAAWVEEAAAIPTSDNEFGQVVLDAFKLATIIKVSRELMADSAFPLESYLARLLKSIAEQLINKAFSVLFLFCGNKMATAIYFMSKFSIFTASSVVFL